MGGITLKKVHCVNPSGIERSGRESVLMLHHQVYPMIANTLFPAQQEDTVAGLTLEACVRTALELGELSPGMEARICAYAAQPVLSDRDQRLLHLLQDALAEGCIRRLKPSSPCQGSGICSLPLSSSSGSVSKEGSK